MKKLKSYAFIILLFLGSTTVFAQSIMDLYFGGNKDNLIKESTRLIHLLEPKSGFLPADLQISLKIQSSRFTEWQAVLVCTAKQQDYFKKRHKRSRAESSR